jgi:cell division protease FtsH
VTISPVADVQVGVPGSYGDPIDVLGATPTARSSGTRPMGRLELRAYKREWRAAHRFRRHAAGALARRSYDLIAGDESTAGSATEAGGFSALRRKRFQLDFDMEDDAETVLGRLRRESAEPVSAAEVAARLTFARQFDERPHLLEQIRGSAPVIVVDVPDDGMLQRVTRVWRDTLLSSSARVMTLAVRHAEIGSYDVAFLVVQGPPKGKEIIDREREALRVLQVGMPLIAVSPLAHTHLSQVIVKAATARFQLPSLDQETIAHTIRIVTGMPCRESLDRAVIAAISLTDLIVAIRWDRTPGQCIAELRRLAGTQRARKTGREIELSDLHGMSEAVKWADSAIRDLNAWRRGEIPWSEVDHAACLVGPPGTGKTLFASAFARATGLELIGCSLASWQSADEGHLGHLLRAMKKDFEKARTQPCVLFIDEIDSFADRSKVRHSHADYVTQVVNAFIAELDGVAGREGIIYLAASNDIGRCDPAILRSGRLNRIIRIGLPNADELERMFRVRLRGELAAESLHDLCLIALGSTGADVERIVKDALRLARHERRSITLADLRKVLVRDEDRGVHELRRAAFHEAGHLLMEIVLFGSEHDLHATIAASGDRGGGTIRTRPAPFAGTYADYRNRLQVLLAGRAAEEIEFSAASHGAGGRGSDLEFAARIAAAMVASLGVAGNASLLLLGQQDDTDKLLSYPEVRRAARAELMSAADASRSMLLEHRRTLEEIAETLLRDGSINGREAAAILRERRGLENTRT